MKKLLEKLINEQGRIVSSASLDEEDIRQAQASNRFWVDENGFGFAWIPPAWVDKPEEYMEIIDKYYPLPSNRSIPERLIPGKIWDDIKKQEEGERKANLN